MLDWMDEIRISMLPSMPATFAPMSSTRLESSRACGPRNTHRGTPAPHPRRRARRQGPQEGCAGGGPHGLRRILRVQQGFYAFQRHTVLSGGIFRSGLFSCQQFVAAYAQRAGQLLQIIQPGQRSAALPFADGLTETPTCSAKPPGKGLPPGAAQGCVR